MACEGDGKKVKDVKVEPSYIIYIGFVWICANLFFNYILRSSL